MNVMILGAAAVVITAILALVIAAYAPFLQLLDHPEGRKQHDKPTPLIGGLAMWLGFSSLAITFVPLTTTSYGLLAALALLVSLGCIDDRHNITAGKKFMVQVVAALILVFFAGCQINSLGNLLFIGELQLAYLTIPLSLFAILCVLNAVNMLDGIDGLAGMTTLCPLTIVALVFAGKSGASHEYLSLLVLFIGALVGFLAHNFRWLSGKPARIFMGDAGSLFLGGMIAWVSINLSQGEDAVVRPAAMLWLFIVPLFDLLTVVILRLKAKVHPTTPGRDHLHHGLLDLGFTSKQTVMLLAGSSLLGSLIAIMAEYLQLAEGWMLVLFVALYVLYLLWRLNIHGLSGTSRAQHAISN